MSAAFAETPDPLREEPPADQFCDVVINGGVASGVVYPWALLKLARHYRFKSIGGNSVGAMAAAMAAAAEYGRCNGVESAFEPLRRMPLELAEENSAGQTRMLRLFQPAPRLRRLFALFLALVSSKTPAADAQPGAKPPRGGLISALLIYELWLPLALLLLLAGWAGCLALRSLGAIGLLPALLGFFGALLLTLLLGVWWLYRDLVALTRNNYGLCTGLGQPGEEGLVQWLHRGIQLSAGRGEMDPPLCFADLWAAPRFGQSGPAPLPGGLQPPQASINLQMFSSNITLGRPVRLPLNDANTRLYYVPDEWRAYFPRRVLEALEQASRPYCPSSASDPDPGDAEQAPLLASLRELPGADMPIVVAARLSLCFPFLFSCVPVYAVDYEAPGGQRRLRRCLLSDGGLCTNFPVHLFDAAHPRWPTFALLLDQRLSKYKAQAVWLPRTHQEGRGDNWQRGVPGAEEGSPPAPLPGLLGLAGGILATMKDWNDRVTGRLPQVRNRTIRMALQEGEGQLNLAMSSATILRMAHEYGTCSGEKLVRRFAPHRLGIKAGWREHLYVRSMIELRALRRHLRGYSQAVSEQGSTLPLDALLDAATRRPPLQCRPDRPDGAAAPLSQAQRQALGRAVQAVKTLEAELAACEAQFGPYQPQPEPELRLRPPI